MRHGLGDDGEAVGQDVAFDGAWQLGHFELGVNSILAHADGGRHSPHFEALRFGAVDAARDLE
jgi:hypothetical protein